MEGRYLCSLLPGQLSSHQHLTKFSGQCLASDMRPKRVWSGECVCWGFFPKCTIRRKWFILFKSMGSVRMNQEVNNLNCEEGEES